MKEVFSFLTDAKTLYWIVGYVALTVYWVGKTKGDPTVNAKNVLLSVLLNFLGLAMGDFLSGTDPGGLTIAYAVSTGLAGGTTVKTVAERRAPK